MKLNIGDPAPDFRLKDQNGKIHQLADYSGERLAIYFYPKDHTPGCTAQACNLRDHMPQLKAAGIRILGVSPDPEASHQRFQEKHSLPFPLLADTEKEMVQAYGVWALKKFMGREFMGVLRTTFLINKEGMIEHIIEKVKTKQHSQQILEKWASEQGMV